MPEAAGEASQIAHWFDSITPKLISWGWKILGLLLIYFIGKRVIHMLLRLVKRTMERSHLEKTIQVMAYHVVQVLLYMLLISTMLKVVGYEAASFVALIGSAGLSIGLAFQGSLSNFAGGVLILITKPFKIGDYIEEDAKKNCGTVKSISICYTTLVTPDEKTVVIPNGTLANTSLTNYSTQGKRRVEVSVGISYGADLKKAKAVMAEALGQVSARIPDSPVQVFVDQLGDSSVQLTGWIWSASGDYLPAKWEATEAIKLALDEAGIHIPYPQMDVHMIEGEQ
ncbi:mechanosensitive ion channel family protein [Hominifimenecus sp. rT4P-3]|uniref:mechanosensitive ion channel family protein n=1 Tax=Hominifimenecus sp. rT4P-3 TaxID=3242979 RepID=UPI003DA308A7